MAKEEIVLQTRKDGSVNCTIILPPPKNKTKSDLKQAIDRILDTVLRCRKGIIGADNLVLGIIRELDVGKGAQWSDVVLLARHQSLSQDAAEDSILALEKSGAIKEERLGTVTLQKNN